MGGAPARPIRQQIPDSSPNRHRTAQIRQQNRQAQNPHQQQRQAPRQHLPNPPPQRRQPHQTAILSSDNQVRSGVHIKRSSVEVKQCYNSQKYYVTFEYDALSECVVNIYFFGSEVIDDRTQGTQQQVKNSIHVESNKSQMEPVSRRLPGVIGGTFPSEEAIIDLNRFKPELYFNYSHKNYPLILEIVNITQSQISNVPTPSETTYARIDVKKSPPKVEVLLQKVHVNGLSYEIQSVYGGNVTTEGIQVEAENECIICIDQKPTWLILPCRHMCVCNNCAEILLQRNEKNCPMCRTEVKKFVKAL